MICVTKMWQKEIETMARKDIEALQLERLKWSVQYSYDRVPFYRKKLDECGIKPEKVKVLSDIQYLPFTTKDDLKNNYPFGMFAQPRKNLVRVHGSSGTTGKPTIVGYTRNDMNNWTDLVARVVTAAGVTDEDVAQIAFGYGLFTGAFGLHQGLERVGAMVVPLSSGNTERQLMLMEDFQTSVLIATPSYAIYLAELIEERGLRDKLNLRIGLFGSESCSADTKAAIEKYMGLMVTDNYGMSELIGPGVAGECHLRQGLHLAEDHFLPEILDSETLQPLAPGETGELVMTSLTKEALPIIRYRTKDITCLNYEPCACGRTHVRMDKIKGRADDMVIIKGVNVFPSQVESAISGIPEVGPHYMLVLHRDGVMDSLEVQVELTSADVLESFSELKRVEKTIGSRLQSVLGLRAKVSLVEPKSLERFQGKAKRIIDLREQEK